MCGRLMVIQWRLLSSHQDPVSFRCVPLCLPLPLLLSLLQLRFLTTLYPALQDSLSPLTYCTDALRPLSASPPSCAPPSTPHLFAQLSPLLPPQRLQQPPGPSQLLKLYNIPTMADEPLSSRFPDVLFSSGFAPTRALSFDFDGGTDGAYRLLELTKEDTDGTVLSRMRKEMRKSVRS
jgi:hypothetical protein